MKGHEVDKRGGAHDNKYTLDCRPAVVRTRPLVAESTFLGRAIAACSESQYWHPFLLSALDPAPEGIVLN